VLEAELSDGLASLLLVARVDGDGSTTGDGSLFTSFRLGAAASVFNAGLGDVLVGKFFDSRVGHVGQSNRLYSFQRLARPRLMLMRIAAGSKQSLLLRCGAFL
jgi:hypothetical protein